MTSDSKLNPTAVTSTNKPDGNLLFPVFLKLNELHTLLIGAGNVGLEKLTALLNNSPQARITIIAENVLPEVRAFTTGYAQVTIVQKHFEDNDLDQADIVVAATGDNDLNILIRQAARQRRLLINVADKPELCDFYLGSIVKKGDLKLAISTNGKSPTVAKRLKEVLNSALPADLDITLQHMNALRNTLSGDFASKVKALNKATSVLSPDAQPAVYPKYSGWMIVFLALIAAILLVIIIVNL